VFLVLCSCWFHFVLLMLLKQVRWSKCRRLKGRWMELCEFLCLFFVLILFLCVIVSLLKQARWSNYKRLKKGG
jgi:hypothetical protein